jgi:hypothetical protein
MDFLWSGYARIRYMGLGCAVAHITLLALPSSNLVQLTLVELVELAGEHVCVHIALALFVPAHACARSLQQSWKIQLEQRVELIPASHVRPIARREGSIVSAPESGGFALGMRNLNARRTREIARSLLTLEQEAQCRSSCKMANKLISPTRMTLCLQLLAAASK